jgi:hypothetical protein
MAEVTKGSVPTPSTLVPPANCIVGGLLAGEVIAAGDMVYVKGADGKVYKTTGAAANEAAGSWGMSPEAASAGEAVSIYHHMSFGYKPNVAGTPSAANAILYLSGTVAGGLANSASTGDAVGVARVIDTDGRIYVYGSVLK